MRKPSLTTHARWYETKRLPSSKVPRQWQHWLLEPGSLTKRLKGHAGQTFSVKIIGEYWGKPTRSEARLLGVRAKQHVYIREVELWGLGCCWVKARTLIPASSFVGSLSSLRSIGNKPLGERLFSNPRVTRGPIEVAQLVDGNTAVWARRSVFSLRNQPLLVNEVFMPSLLRVE